MELPQNRFKRRLHAGDKTTGLWCAIPHPIAVEVAAGAGFDWIVLDTEHTSAEVSDLLPLLQAADAYPTGCLVRPHVHDTALIKRHLDQGAQTLILPYIQSAGEAAAAVAATRYPPAGQRGMAGNVRAARYGRVRDYIARAADELCLILQVETVGALDQIEAIAAVEGVDAVFIGPADLSASMGYPGQADHPEVREAILTAIDRVTATGKRIGLLTLNQAFARECLDRGASFVAVGIDVNLLVAATDTLSGSFRS